MGHKDCEAQNRYYFNVNFSKNARNKKFWRLLAQSRTRPLRTLTAPLVRTYFAPLNSEIVERKVVTQSAILPGIRSDGIKFAQADAMQSIILGKKNWIISNSYILDKNNSSTSPLQLGQMNTYFTCLFIILFSIYHFWSREIRAILVFCFWLLLLVHPPFLKNIAIECKDL